MSPHIFGVKPIFMGSLRVQVPKKGQLSVANVSRRSSTGDCPRCRTFRLRSGEGSSPESLPLLMFCFFCLFLLLFAFWGLLCFQKEPMQQFLLLWGPLGFFQKNRSNSSSSFPVVAFLGPPLFSTHQAKNIVLAVGSEFQPRVQA